MTALRSLLRLEDKVAAEGRRLQQIGGPSLGHLLPAIIVAVLVLHGAVLFLPAIRTRASLPAASVPQDFPLVWRMAAPSPPVVSVPEAPRPTPAGGPARPPSAARATARAPQFEPVPEPAPELGGIAMIPDFDAVIPPPDAPPPSIEPGPPSSSAAATPAPAPALVHRVPPVYPVLARSLRAESRVTVRLVLAADGGVAEASVLGCTRPGLGFEAAALEAVKRWRYEPQPARSGPRAVIVTVVFKRQEGSP